MRNSLNARSLNANLAVFLRRDAYELGEMSSLSSPKSHLAVWIMCTLFTNLVFSWLPDRSGAP